MKNCNFLICCCSCWYPFCKVDYLIYKSNDLWYSTAILIIQTFVCKWLDGISNTNLRSVENVFNEYIDSSLLYKAHTDLWSSNFVIRLAHEVTLIIFIIKIFLLWNSSSSICDIPMIFELWKVCCCCYNVSYFFSV